MKKMNLALYYIVCFIYLEVLYRILLMEDLFIISNINTLIFVIFFSLGLYIITKLFNEKVNKIFFFFFITIIPLWFAAQYVVKSFFDFYLSFSILRIADQVGDFLDKALIEIFKRIFQIMLFMMPLILGIIFKKDLSFKRITKKELIFYPLGFTFSFIIYYGSLFINKNESYSAYELYHYVNEPSLNIEKVGILNTLCIDTYRTVFGFEEKLYLEDTIHLDDLGIDNNDSLEESKYNNLDIDFEKLLNNSDDEIKLMTQYFMHDEGTKQNEYTGFFEDKNLILFMAESFNEIAVNQKITPTLYKLVNSGFVFDNFYSPTIYSTIGGEYQELTGLYANFSSLSQFRLGNNTYPMGIATSFQNKGYNTYTYHNNAYDFQNRNIYLEKLGFNNYKACYNGLEKKINCEIWPQSDVEMIESTMDEYLYSDNPFMVYYVTVSSHSGYTFLENAMARKNQNIIESFNLPYSDGILAYLAASIELDKALEILINRLEETGKLSDTVIALVGDHYPYELTIEEINEIASYEKDDKIEVNKSNLIIWNSEMQTINIEKVGSQIDVLPTIYNLFKIPYDSRLIIGKDILSDVPGLAIFDNRSWVSDKGSYFSTSDEFISKDGNVDDTYIKMMNQIVNNKINMSKYIMDYNYYEIVWKYVN